LNLQKAFENRQDRPWLAFKNGGCCAARFSKDNCLIGNTLGGFQTVEMALAGFQKLLAQL
jgi:hypothetical protein